MSEMAFLSEIVKKKCVLVNKNYETKNIKLNKCRRRKRKKIKRKIQGKSKFLTHK